MLLATARSYARAFALRRGTEHGVPERNDSSLFSFPLFSPLFKDGNVPRRCARHESPGAPAAELRIKLRSGLEDAASLVPLRDLIENGKNTGKYVRCHLAASRVFLCQLKRVSSRTRRARADVFGCRYRLQSSYLPTSTGLDKGACRSPR